MAHTLLLADDSVTIQRVIELTFADEDIRVVTVGDGQQAIDRIESDPPDIILADVGMPNRDGYEVASHVKQTARLSHIPVLLLTGAFEPVDEARATAAGCDGVLAKPFEPQMVINRVRELLSDSHAHAPRPEGSALPSKGGSHVSAPAAAPAPAPARAKAPADDFDITPPPVARRPVQAAQPAPPAAKPDVSLSLDEYFDKLDAAFGGAGTVAPALRPFDEEEEREKEPPTPVHEPVRREPPKQEPPPKEPPRPPAREALRRDLAGALAEAGVEPPQPPPSRAARRRGLAGASPEAGEPEKQISEAPLAGAFATLLAAERAEPIPSTTRVPLRSLFPALSPSNDELVDQIARRVLDRLTDHDFVSDIVVRVTERIVREEIERLRATLHGR